MTVRILRGDCREILRTLEDESVHCVVTSPPYWGLRDYGVVGQLGLERSLGEHLETMVDVFREVRRVLRSDGSLWLNYGDCYATSPNGRSAADTKAAGNDDRTFRDKPFSTVGAIYAPDHESGDRRGGECKQRRNEGSNHPGRIVSGAVLKPKDLCMIPNRLAIAMQEDGWWVRSEIIWGKPNPMPDSSGKYRPSTAHEKIFLMTKTGKSFYDSDSVALPCSPNTHARISQDVAKQVGSARAPLFVAAVVVDTITHGAVSRAVDAADQREIERQFHFAERKRRLDTRGGPQSYPTHADYLRDA